MVRLFGWEIRRDTKEEDARQSFVEPVNEDGAMAVASGVASSSFIDLEGAAKTEAELVTRYRAMLMQPEVQQAVDDIVNEAVNVDQNEDVVELVTDDVDLPESIKKKIREEFETVLDLLDFNKYAYDVFSKWYVDGRINYHVIIDEKNPKKGILELRYVDPRKIRKVREFEPEKVEGTNYVVKKLKNEYYIFNDRGFDGKMETSPVSYGINDNVQGLKIAKDAIVHSNSGLLNERNSVILSHLHKAYKPLNQLRMMEDASVIYRISRAPERRVFYIDVGNLPKIKAEQYLREMMVNHKNKLVYDAATGEMKDDRKFMTVTDDFWLPRREGGRGTQIETLPGGQNLGEMDDIEYFKKKLYKSLNVPTSRLEPETGFSLGRASEISRDEIKFSKFIRRLRVRFSTLFNKCLEKQLILKGIIKPEEWDKIDRNLKYDFKSDSYFEELKEGEILRERINTLREVNEFVGEYYSKEWVRKNILRQSEDEIKEMDKQIKAEGSDEEDDMDAFGGGIGAIPPQQPVAQPRPTPAPPAPQPKPQEAPPAKQAPEKAA